MRAGGEVCGTVAASEGGEETPVLAASSGRLSASGLEPVADAPSGRRRIIDMFEYVARQSLS